MLANDDVAKFDHLPVGQAPFFEQGQQVAGFLQRGFDAIDDDRAAAFEHIFADFTPHVPVENTDDHPVLEFMVVRGLELDRPGDDPFVVRQQELNIDPVRRGRLDGSIGLVRRAEVYYFLGAEQFTQNFLPALRADPEAWRIWREAGYPEL